MSGEEKITVKLGKHRAVLSPPRSFALCSEIAAAAVSNWRRGHAAALWFCWSGRPGRNGKPALDYALCHHNPLELGGQMIDALHAAGVPHAEVIEGGARAWGLVVSSLPTESEVSDVEGNSAPAMAG